MNHQTSSKMSNFNISCYLLLYMEACSTQGLEDIYKFDLGFLGPLQSVMSLDLFLSFALNQI